MSDDLDGVTMDVVSLEEATIGLLRRVFDAETVERLMNEPQALFGRRTGKEFVEEDGWQAMINRANAMYEGGMSS